MSGDRVKNNERFMPGIPLWHQQEDAGLDVIVNLVDENWTGAVGMCGMDGNAAGPKTMAELLAYMKILHNLDVPRQGRIRTRVKLVVKDPIVAKSYKSGIPCKRPTFHHDYLETFDRENVTLVDTGGKGLQSMTADSLVAGEQSYPVDIIICTTGSRAPFTGSPAHKASMTIIGSSGVSTGEE